MGRALETIRDIMADEGWEHLISDADQCLQVLCNGAQGSWHLMVWEHSASQHIALISEANFFAPAQQRSDIARLLMGLNQHLLSGAFLLDFERGSIRFKSTLFYGEEVLSSDTLMEFFYSHLAVFDQSLPLIEEVIFAQLPTSEAIGRAQKLYSSRRDAA